MICWKILGLGSRFGVAIFKIYNFNLLGQGSAQGEGPI